MQCVVFDVRNITYCLRNYEKTRLKRKSDKSKLGTRTHKHEQQQLGPTSTTHAKRRTTMAGIKGKSGAPKGNKNAMTTGARLDLRRLVVGELPLPMIAVKREGRAYRRAL